MGEKNENGGFLVPARWLFTGFLVGVLLLGLGSLGIGYGPLGEPYVHVAEVSESDVAGAHTVPYGDLSATEQEVFRTAVAADTPTSGVPGEWDGPRYVEREGAYYEVTLDEHVRDPWYDLSGALVVVGGGIVLFAGLLGFTQALEARATRERGSDRDHR